jgi:hypothetical protein
VHPFQASDDEVFCSEEGKLIDENSFFCAGAWRTGFRLWNSSKLWKFSTPFLVMVQSKLLRLWLTYDVGFSPCVVRLEKRSLADGTGRPPSHMSHSSYRNLLLAEMKNVFQTL